MTDPQHQSQTPLSSQEGVQELAEQHLEMIIGAGDPVTHKEYEKIYNSVSPDLRVPLLSSNKSEAIKVSENMIAKETPNFFKSEGVRYNAPVAYYNKGKFEGEIRPY
jgi:hypothetical protein